MKCIIIGLLVVGGTMIGCSGGGGGAGGGGSSASLVGALQAKKVTCYGSSCTPVQSLGVLAVGDDEVLLGSYSELNNVLIPALNSVIARIEKGVAEAGVNSCDFIGDDDADGILNADLPLEGTIEGGATTYKVEASTLAIPVAFQNATEWTSAGLNHFENFTKRISAKDSVGTFLELDFICGHVDNWPGSDPTYNPLIARVLMIDRATGNKINAYFSKGTLNNRILMAAQIGSKKYKAFFSTQEFLNPQRISFSMGYGEGVNYFTANGATIKSPVSYEVLAKVNGGADTCYVSTTCPQSGTLAPDLSGIDATGLITDGLTWVDAVVDDTKLLAPVF